jgi:hypothetical protein
MGLAGAVILILAMANALINYVIQQRIPTHVLDSMLQLGLTETWQFLIVMNVFLLVLGMLMDGFSAILVAVPLILPFAARFTLGPFHLAMIFLLNLEIAYCCPPLGLNLFIASFRFSRPVVSLYRVVLPFAAILTSALILVSYVPAISNVFVAGDLAAARAKSDALGVPPREAWLLECVQEDRSNPQPCTPADRAKWPHGEAPAPAVAEKPAAAPTTPAAAAAEGDDEALLRQMMGGAAAKPAASGSAAPAPAADDDDALLQKMMGGAPKDAGKAAAPAPSAAPASPADDEAELLKKMGVK